MKKCFALLLALSLLFSLTGCGSGEKTAEPTPAPAAETASPVSTEVPAAEEPAAAEAAAGQIIIEIRRKTETVYDLDGVTALLSYAEALPSVTIPADRTAEEKINAALTAAHDLFANGSPDTEGVSGKAGYVLSAREDLQWRRSEGLGEDFVLYSLERDANVTRCDERVISFIYTDYTYTGGVHGYAGLSGVNYDAVTGEELKLSDLADDAGAFLAECAEFLYEVSRDADHAGFIQGYYPGYEEYLPGLLRDGLWYFTREGMTVVANPYEIAPYASGRIEFTLPYEWLRWHMKEEYLPPEAEADGELLGEIADEPGECLYTADMDTDGQGACVVFTATGSVRGLRVLRTGWNEYSNTFYESGDVLFVSRMEEGDRLCIRTWIPDVIPDLKLKYTDASGQEREFLISQSGEDGSLNLMDARPWTELPVEISGRVPFVYDIDRDGEYETVDLVPQPEEDGRWALTVDGVKVDDLYSVSREQCSLWLADIDWNGTMEILFSGDMGSDDYVTCAWRGDTLEPISFTGENRRGANPWEITSSVDGRAVMSSWQLYIESWSYQLGTYRAVRAYTVADGVIAPAARNGWTYDSNTFDLVVKRNLPVTMDSGTFRYLAPGKTIRLTGTEGNVVHFSTADGETGVIYLDYVHGDNGGWTINGVSENEYFEMLPYAG